MDNEKYEMMKREIKEDILKDLNNRNYRKAMAKNDMFNSIRNEYLKDGPLFEAFGTITFYKVWEHIRRLAIICVDEQYLINLTPEKRERAAKIAEHLCSYCIKVKREMEDDSSNNLSEGG